MTSNEFELLFKEYWTDTASGLASTLEAITKNYSKADYANSYK